MASGSGEAVGIHYLAQNSEGFHIKSQVLIVRLGHHEMTLQHVISWYNYMTNPAHGRTPLSLRKQRNAPPQS